MADTGQNIIICCDGTDNTFGRAETNVRRLFNHLKCTEHIVYYDPGLGTIPSDAFGSTVGKGLSRLAGRAVAFGLTRNVLEAYEFLMEHYDPENTPAEPKHSGVFLFGFSRGAFTVRRLAKLVAVCGLPPKGGKNLIPYAYHAYIKFKVAKKLRDKEKTLKPGQRLKPRQRKKLKKNEEIYESFKKLAIPCEPRFVGVWDTVRSVGLKMEPITCELVDGIDYARHALALHEQRSVFRPEIWDPEDSKRIEQRWFSGDHSDVGGGHDNVNGKPLEDRDDLSYLSLQWMVNEANKKDLPVEKRFLVDLQEKTDRLCKGFANRTEFSDKTKKWYWRMTRKPRAEHVEETHVEDPSVEKIMKHIAQGTVKK